VSVSGASVVEVETARTTSACSGSTWAGRCHTARACATMTNHWLRFPRWLSARSPTSMFSTTLAPRAWRRALPSRIPHYPSCARCESSLSAPEGKADEKPVHTAESIIGKTPTKKSAKKSVKEKPRTIFSGIQPTGIPHLGNYLGALREWVKLQDEAPGDTRYFSIVDLHAITMRQRPDELYQNKNAMFASLLAVGLDPQKSVIFEQSAVPHHAELMWILSCIASMGYLGRMTQWKVRPPRTYPKASRC
jgi:hypothetical protein